MQMCHMGNIQVSKNPTLPFAYGLVTVKGGIRVAEGQSPPANRCINHFVVFMPFC